MFNSFSNEQNLLKSVWKRYETLMSRLLTSAKPQINDSCSDLGIVHLFHWHQKYKYCTWFQDEILYVSHSFLLSWCRHLLRTVIGHGTRFGHLSSASAHHCPVSWVPGCWDPGVTCGGQAGQLARPAPGSDIRIGAKDIRTLYCIDMAT